MNHLEPGEGIMNQYDRAAAEYRRQMLAEQAREAIRCNMQTIHDVASEHGQVLDDVKHTRWFLEAVADKLAEA